MHAVEEAESLLPTRRSSRIIQRHHVSEPLPGFPTHLPAGAYMASQALALPPLSMPGAPMHLTSLSREGCSRPLKRLLCLHSVIPTGYIAWVWEFLAMKPLRGIPAGFSNSKPEVRDDHRCCRGCPGEAV